MTDNYSTTAIILAAGSSKRFGENKLLATINGKTILNITIDKFEASKFVDSIIIVTSNSLKSTIKDIIGKSESKKTKDIVIGGNTRQDSVRNALLFLKDNNLNCSYVAIHDGARPLIKTTDIDKCIQGALKFKASAPGVRPKDTIKQAESAFSKTIINTPPREELWAIQTPQCFEFNLILDAHLKAFNSNFYTTDDCALAEFTGTKPEIIESCYTNIKITTPEDLLIAKIFCDSE